jgi:hypothetical protein
MCLTRDTAKIFLEYGYSKFFFERVGYSQVIATEGRLDS